MTIARNVRDGTMGRRDVGARSIPQSSMYYAKSLSHAGQHIRGRILAQNGTVRFAEDGTYEPPAGPVVVLWALDVGGEFVENVQSLVGSWETGYPDLPVDDETDITPRAGIRIERAENGKIRGQRMFPQTIYDLTLVHRHVSEVERLALLAHFAGFASQQFDVATRDGEIYRVRYLETPHGTPLPGGQWTMTVRLSGPRLFTIFAGSDEYPDLPLDLSSQFVPNGGLRIDVAEDGQPRTKGAYPDIIYDITLVHPHITGAERTALLEHFVGTVGEAFDYETPTGTQYRVQYVEEPRGIKYIGGLWTMSVRLVGTLL